ncbi:hypothetical protein niasHT_003893 [Heterodera trifolii]|uniref:F-box domain-containing protein n=1 Tax=Heterodera trifolii TaxID=157864 RepID=A0ABD2LWZ4_9BILA
MTEKEHRNLRNNSIRICDDVCFDLLHFLHRVDHQRINLISRRFRWLSASVERRYPSRAIRALFVVGTPQNDQSSDQQPRFLGNSISVCPSVGAPYAVDFATVAPPANVSRISELEICDFIGPQLIEFLRVSAPLLDGCCLIFDDFENFVRLHSFQFVHQFFALFPDNRSVELRFVSSSTAPFFSNHPFLFGCVELGIECTADFPLDCLYGWLCQDISEENKRKRCLDIRFGTFVHVKKCLDAVGQFVNFVKHRFLHSSDWCPFYVEIELLGGPHIPELDTFTEHNERTGEQLTFARDELARLYSLERRKSTEKGADDGQRADNGAEGSHGSGGVHQHSAAEYVYSMYHSVVFIRQIFQGDISIG